MENKILMLFDCCKLTKGSNRGIIIDFHRFKYFYVPNDLIDFLIQVDRLSLKEIKQKYIVNKDSVDEYLDFLLENEIITYIESNISYCFPKMDENYEYPGLIQKLNSSYKCNFWVKQ